MHAHRLPILQKLPLNWEYPLLFDSWQLELLVAALECMISQYEHVWANLMRRNCYEGQKKQLWELYLKYEPLGLLYDKKFLVMYGEDYGERKKLVSIGFLKVLHLQSGFFILLWLVPVNKLKEKSSTFAGQLVLGKIGQEGESQTLSQRFGAKH